MVSFSHYKESFKKAAYCKRFFSLSNWICPRRPHATCISLSLSLSISILSSNLSLYLFHFTLSHSHAHAHTHRHNHTLTHTCKHTLSHTHISTHTQSQSDTPFPNQNHVKQFYLELAELWLNCNARLKDLKNIFIQVFLEFAKWWINLYWRSRYCYLAIRI